MLLIRISSLPSSRLTVSATARTCSLFVTSRDIWWTLAKGLGVLMEVETESSSLAVRAQITSVATPLSAYFNAMERPIPRPAPVMSTVKVRTVI